MFFDVDFTLIFPGPTFHGEGYRQFCVPYGIDVDPALFEAAAAASSFILDEVQEQIYTHDLFVHYTASIIDLDAITDSAMSSSAAKRTSQRHTR